MIQTATYSNHLILGQRRILGNNHQIMQITLNNDYLLLTISYEEISCLYRAIITSLDQVYLPSEYSLQSSSLDGLISDICCELDSENFKKFTKGFKKIKIQRNLIIE